MHLSSEEALDLIDKKASQDQVHFWHEHLPTCASCGNQLQAWQRIRTLLKRENLESAPDFATRAAELIFEPRPARQPLREVLASLVFDSFAQPALAGARGFAAARQLLLSAEEIDVHLRVWTLGTQRRIAGQILSRDKDAKVEGTQLHLLFEGKRIESAEADGLGEFEFLDSTSGSLELEIELAHTRIKGSLNLS